MAQIRWLEADAFIFLPAYFVIDVMGVVWNEKDNCCACNTAYLHGLHPNLMRLIGIGLMLILLDANGILITNRHLNHMMLQ